MKEIECFILMICCSLVDTPESVNVVTEVTGEKILFIISPDKHEIGQLVGEKGCIANSLRTIVKSFAKKQGFSQVFLTVAESKTSL